VSGAINLGCWDRQKDEVKAQRFSVLRIKHFHDFTLFALTYPQAN
jgi:hypothetical protein